MPPNFIQSNFICFTIGSNSKASFVFDIHIYNYWNLLILFHYPLRPLNHLFSFHIKLCFFSSPAEIIDTIALLFFYYILKFLDQHNHTHHHHICYFCYFIFCHLIANHFQIILIIHHFQMDHLPLRHSNRNHLLHYHLLIFYYFSYHFCRVDCLFSFIYYIFNPFLF